MGQHAFYPCRVDWYWDTANTTRAEAFSLFTALSTAQANGTETLWILLGPKPVHFPLRFPSLHPTILATPTFLGLEVARRVSKSSLYFACRDSLSSHNRFCFQKKICIPYEKDFPWPCCTCNHAHIFAFSFRNILRGFLVVKRDSWGRFYIGGGYWGCIGWVLVLKGGWIPGVVYWRCYEGGRNFGWPLWWFGEGFLVELGWITCE